jgi:ketosteroid isomerase-like protein
MTGFFGRWAPHFQTIYTEADAYCDAGSGNVFVDGRYRGTTTGGRELEVRFTHHWTVVDGKLAALRQAADSHLAREAIGM